MDLQRVAALRLLLATIRARCLLTPLPNLLENALKVDCLHALLLHGYQFMEGTSRAGRGKVVSLSGERLEFQYVARESLETSPDIRIVSPVDMVLELQARSLFGTQDTLFSHNVLDDLNRVQRGAAHAFLLASDAPIYNALRGLRQNNRGRKAAAPDELAVVLPASDKLANDFPNDPVQCEDSRFMHLGACFISNFGTERVVVVIWRTA